MLVFKAGSINCGAREVNELSVACMYFPPRLDERLAEVGSAWSWNILVLR